MRLDDRRLLARMGGSRDQHLTLADCLLHFGELFLVGRRRRHVELEIAGHSHDRHAEFRIALGIECRLREADVELAENGGRGALERTPGLERFFRHAAVDQQQRNARLGTRDDQVRPQIGFDENAEIGLPVRQKAVDETRRIERDELVQHVFRQPAFGDLGGGHSAGGNQHPHMALAQLADQRKHRGQFADACAMQPDQRTLGPFQGRLTVSLADPLLQFLAAAQTPLQPERSERRCGRHDAPIGAQGHGQAFSHGYRCRSCRRQSRRRVPWRC